MGIITLTKQTPQVAAALTREMISAGVIALEWWRESADDWGLVGEIYKAMRSLEVALTAEPLQVRCPSSKTTALHHP